MLGPQRDLSVIGPAAVHKHGNEVMKLAQRVIDAVEACVDVLFEGVEACVDVVGPAVYVNEATIQAPLAGPKPPQFGIDVIAKLLLDSPLIGHENVERTPGPSHTDVSDFGDHRSSHSNPLILHDNCCNHCYLRLEAVNYDGGKNRR